MGLSFDVRLINPDPRIICVRKGLFLMHIYPSRAGFFAFLLVSVALGGTIHAATVSVSGTDVLITLGAGENISDLNASTAVAVVTVNTVGSASNTLVATPAGVTITNNTVVIDTVAFSTFTGFRVVGGNTTNAVTVGATGIDLTAGATTNTNQTLSIDLSLNNGVGSLNVTGPILSKNTGNVGLNSTTVVITSAGDITATTGSVMVTGNTITSAGDVTSAGPLNLTGTGDISVSGFVSVASVTANSSGGSISFGNIATTTGATITGGLATNVNLSGTIVSGGAFNIGAGLTGINVSDNTELILNSTTLGSTFASPLVINPSGSGTFRLLGMGALTLSADSTAGVTSSDTINVTNGTLNVTGKLNRSSTVTLTNGTLTGPGGTVGSLNLGSGTVIPRGTLNTGAVSFNTATTYSVGVLTTTTASNLKTASAINLGGQP